MSVQTEKEMLCINQIIGQKTQTIMVETDCVVPDIKPDILNTISTNGTICIYKKEVLDGKIKIDGTINSYIIYLADNENSEIRSLNTNVDFSQTIEIENVREGMILEENCTLKSIECRVLNGRKINIKGVIDINLEISSNENLEFVKQISDVKDIQLLNEEMKINSLLGNGTTIVYAKDTLMIDNTCELAEVMKVNVDIKNRETKISYNKVLIKADACVKVMYLSTDNRINIVNNVIPVMGFIDIQNVTDDNMCDVKYEIKNLLVKPNNVEEHSIYVEIEIDANCNVYETKELNIIQDLYSPTTNLVYKQRNVRTMAERQCVKDMCPIREKQFISEIGNNKIYDVDITPIISNRTILNDRIVYDGELELKFMFAQENSSKMLTKIINLPFNYNMECIGISQSSEIDTQIEISSQDFIVMPDESIDIKIDINFMVNASNKKNINVIEQIDIEENREDERFSIVVYFVKPGDTLWKIAKMFKSTVSNISKLNDIENENKINVGEQLFIPMFR